MSILNSKPQPCNSSRQPWSPEQTHTQAGTLSGNPLAMTAGIKTLEIMDRPGVYEYLDKITGRLINGILDAGRAAGHQVCGGHINGGRPSSGVNLRKSP